MAQILYMIAAVITIVGGIGAIVKNWEWIKNILAEWTRRGIKVIYVLPSHDNQEGTTLYLYLCGEEKSWLFPEHCHTNCNSCILAIKSLHYDPSYGSYSDRADYSEWMSQFPRPLSEEPLPTLVQLVGESRFRFGFYSDNDKPIIVFDSFKLKTEMAECLRKYRIKYDKKARKAIDRWKIKNRYPI